MRSSNLVNLALASIVSSLIGCGGGGVESSTTQPTVVSRVASDVTIPADAGVFFEGVSAAPDGTLYIGSDTGNILKASPNQTSFSEYFSFSNPLLLVTPFRLITGTRVRGSKLYFCLNDDNPFDSIARPAFVYSIDITGSMGQDSNLYALPDGEIFCNDLAFDSTGNLFVTTRFLNGSGTNSVYRLPVAKVDNPSPIAGFISASGSDWISYFTSNRELNGLAVLAGKLYWSEFLTEATSTLYNDSTSRADESQLSVRSRIINTALLDGLQFNAAGNIIGVAESEGNKQAVVVKVTNGTVGAVSTIPGSTCQTTIALVGSDGFCSSDDGTTKSVKRVRNVSAL